MTILYQKGVIPGIAKCCAGRFIIINNKMKYYPSKKMLCYDRFLGERFAKKVIFIKIE